MATSIATRALPPRAAVALAAVLNFVGAFLSLKVAATIAEDIVDLDGLVGEVLAPAVLAPLLALTVAPVATFLIYRMIGRRRERTARGFRLGQLASASLVALSHGTNDAQKTMGVITLALIASGTLEKGDGTPTWVIVSAATAIAVGTFVGGWRIIDTLANRVTEIGAPQGFSAETTSATVILAVSQAGFPLSTTHVTSGSVMGAGVIAPGFYLLTDALGPEIAGPVAVSVIAAGAAAWLFIQTQRSGAIRAGDFS